MLDGRSLAIHGTAFPLLCAAEPACCLPAAKNDSDVRKGSALGRSIKALLRGWGRAHDQPVARPQRQAGVAVLRSERFDKIALARDAAARAHPGLTAPAHSRES